MPSCGLLIMNKILQTRQVFDFKDHKSQCGDSFCSVFKLTNHNVATVFVRCSRSQITMWQQFLFGFQGHKSQCGDSFCSVFKLTNHNVATVFVRFQYHKSQCGNSFCLVFKVKSHNVATVFVLSSRSQITMWQQFNCEKKRI